MAATRRRISDSLYTIVTGLAGCLPAYAHHSFAIYDADDPRSIEGIVEEFRWTNPHTMVRLRVDNGDGTESIWQLDFDPVNMLVRRGWTAETLERGDTIAADSHPLHSGQPGGRLIDFAFNDQPTTIDTSGSGSATILDVPPPEPVAMSDAVARDFNGIWFNANGGLHFDSTVPRAAQQPPLRPQYMAQWRERQADARAGIATADPTATCAPAGFPRFLSMVYPGEILQAEHQLNWYAEWGEATVRIYLDGREPPADLQLSYNGFTTGHWQGNTLVTRTVGLRGDTLIDTTGIPHSEQLSVVMRMRKITPDYFEVAVTLEDPVVFLEPWSTVKHFVRGAPGEYAREFSCFEGNRYRLSGDGSIEVVIE
jgi:hypothetical protein